MYLTLKKRMQVILISSGIVGILVWAFVNYCRFQTIWFGIPTSRKIPYVLLTIAVLLFAHKWVKLNQEEKKLQSLFK